LKPQKNQIFVFNSQQHGFSLKKHTGRAAATLERKKQVMGIFYQNAEFFITLEKL
jgi:hypothetical protein